jgi:hypothetical protein
MLEHDIRIKAFVAEARVHDGGIAVVVRDASDEEFEVVVPVGLASIYYAGRPVDLTIAIANEDDR